MTDKCIELIDAIVEEETDKALELIKQIKEINPKLLGEKREKTFGRIYPFTLNWTPLMFSCRYLLKEVALSLIDTGYSNPQEIDETGFTALLIACYSSEKNYGSEEIALASGIKSNITPSSNFTVEISQLKLLANSNNLL